MSGTASRSHLRVGATFAKEDAKVVLAALREAAYLIRDMPAMYLTHQDGTPVLQVVRTRSTASSDRLSLDRSTLAPFGTIRVPRVIWRAMQRFAVRIEPALVAEWIRHMREYSDRQERQLDEPRMAAASTWSDPVRTTTVARNLALDLLGRGREARCVWSGKRLTSANLDIDHCFRSSAWPCGDLWNLVPSDRQVNQRSKRDRLPSAEAMQASADAIKSWWLEAYLAASNPRLSQRFQAEAFASLPGLAGGDVDDVHAAVGMQRVRLRRNQGVPEWTWSRLAGQ